MKEDYRHIVATAADYVMGVAENDQNKIKRAFDFSKAQMKLVNSAEDSESVYVLPIPVLWEKAWSKLPSNPDARFEVLDLTVHQGKMASLCLNVNNMYLDRLSLYKVNDTWKIYDKMSLPWPGGNAPKIDLASIFGKQ